MKIDKLIADLDGIIQSGVNELPQIKALYMLKSKLKISFDYLLPSQLCFLYKNVGKIKFDIDETFFDDEDKANEALTKLALVIKKIFDYVRDNADTVDNWEETFGDILASMIITLHENGEG
jgi:hypothetical protein